jgi:hypothetical protein
MLLASWPESLLCLTAVRSKFAGYCRIFICWKDDAKYPEEVSAGM